jgi:hypothetical protein
MERSSALKGRDTPSDRTLTVFKILTTIPAAAPRAMLSHASGVKTDGTEATPNVSYRIGLNARNLL